MSIKPRDTEASSEEEKLPLEISDTFFAELREKSATVLKTLQEKGEGEFSVDFKQLLTLCDRLNLNLRGEQMKVQHMTENHIDATKRVEEAVKISQRDRDTIGKLREEIVEAWSLMENSKMKEIQALEKVEEMREKNLEQQQDILKLSIKVDTSDLGQMGKHQKTVIQEIERLTAEIDDLNHRLSMQRTYADEIQKKLDESQEKNRDLFYEWDQATNESISNKKRLDTMKKNLEQLEEANYDLTQNLNHYQTQSESRLRTLKEREHQSALMKDELEKVKSSNIALAAAKGKLELNLKTINSELNNMKHLVDQTKNFMRLKEDENKKLVIENERNLKKIEAQIRKIAEISLTTSRKENEIQTLKSEITSAEKERDSIKRANDLMKKEKENFQKKTESLMKETEKRDGKILEFKVYFA